VILNLQWLPQRRSKSQHSHGTLTRLLFLGFILRTFVKKPRQTPHHELELAQKRLKEWINAQNR
jgi:phage-related protein